MLRPPPQPMKTECGFTLVELLVTILLIGVLSAIALPAFLGQQQGGEDADAKSNARNAVSSLEMCFTETRAYDACDDSLELQAAGSTLSAELTDAATMEKGAVSITATATTYTVVGYSTSSNSFAISKAANGATSRSCTTGGTGGCKPGAIW